MLKRMICFLAVIFCTMSFGCVDSDLEEISLESETLQEVTKEDNQTEICVFVCGAVNDAGVYMFREGSRIFEAIEAAGGFSEDAAEEALNQAEVLQDEMKLYVPTVEELQSQSESTDGKVNINTATKDELMELPGVGEAKAMQIISYRETHGLFTKIEDIMSISGIKEGLFEKIKEYITV